MERCSWCLKDNLYKQYHDNEWGVPTYDNTKLFEFLNLEGAQAGLSWYTVLKKKRHYFKVFDGWQADKIANYNERKIISLLQDPGIIRNRLKVNACVNNAKKYLEIHAKSISFSEYIWQFVDGQPIINHWQNLDEVPTTTDISDKMSQQLKTDGFKFVGSTICYAFMQATGMVNDHILTCWKRN